MTVTPVRTLKGDLRAPSDKSLTHRAYLLGSIASGASLVRQPLRSEDCDATLGCLAQMGLHYEQVGDDVWLSPVWNWRQPDEPLDCGNSGTTMRLLAGLVASRELTVTLIGDESLSRRPMQRIAEPLRFMGAVVEGETAPLRIKGSDHLVGIDYVSPVASAQVKSCTLLAGLRASGETWVFEPSKSRDHTERMLRALGVQVMEDKRRGVGIVGEKVLEPFEFRVPSDISSAAFFLVASALLPHAEVRLADVNVNPTRTGILEVFSQCGIHVARENHQEEMGEPVADLVVTSNLEPRAFEIGGDLVPRLIDELPVLAVLATQCRGVSRITNAEELRVKESDRITKMAEGLRRMGAKIETREDGMDIEGPTRLRGAHIDAERDHRIAMSFAVAGLLADGETVISGAESIATSFPGFEQALRSLSLD